MDANATVPPSDAAIAAWMDASRSSPLNPSSAHAAGRNALRLIEEARYAVADFLGGEADPDGVHFVSGGTEANNLVINGFARIAGSAIATLAVEHPSVTGPVRAAGGTFLPVRPDGVADLAALSAFVRAAVGSPFLACVQAANSETGVVQPLDRVIACIREANPGAFVMVDAAQAVGRVAVGTDGVDALTFSGHKVHAPSGTGVLYLSDRLKAELPRLVLGGGQEGGFRAGTQSVAGACGLAAALAERKAGFLAAVKAMAALRDRFEALVTASCPTAAVVGRETRRVPNTSCIMFPGSEAQSLMARLDAMGVACSMGTACSSGRPQGSPVLKSMGFSDRDASSSLRFSFSVMNTMDEVEEAAAAVGRAAAEEGRLNARGN